MLCHKIQLVASLVEDSALLKITAKEFRRHLSSAVAKSACGIVCVFEGRVWRLGGWSLLLRADCQLLLHDFAQMPRWRKDAETQWPTLFGALEMIPHTSSIRYCGRRDGRWNAKKTGRRKRERDIVGRVRTREVEGTG